MAWADGETETGLYEPLVTESLGRKELVLVHSRRPCPSGLTRKWLATRPWISQHYHLEVGDLKKSPDHHEVGGEEKPSFSWDQLERFSPLRRSFLWHLAREQFERYNLQLPDLANFLVPTLRFNRDTRKSPRCTANDVARLARRILGLSVGLVLGGGGARGIAHLGVIQQLEEAGIPIDAIGGTSIGAMVGALYARDGKDWHNSHVNILHFYFRDICGVLVGAWVPGGVTWPMSLIPWSPGSPVIASIEPCGGPLGSAPLKIYGYPTIVYPPISPIHKPPFIDRAPFGVTFGLR